MICPFDNTIKFILFDQDISGPPIFKTKFGLEQIKKIKEINDRFYLSFYETFEYQL